MAVSGTDARVVLVGGPSGAGKSRLCRRLAAEHGWPVVRLDDFYKDAGDPSLPMSDLGIADWDDVRSWHAGHALDALRSLVRDGEALVPDYSISESRRTGSSRLTCEPGSVILAEGIFAADLVPAVRDARLLADAWCIRRDPWVTFGLRLARDLREHRKPPAVLWSRGHQLRRADRSIVAAQVALGARPLTPNQAVAVAAALR